MQAQPKNLLHGVTLQRIIETLEAEYGWADLGQRININCFIEKPSVKSSLTFLRKTPWARAKVERLFIQLEIKRERTKTRAEKVS